PPLPETRALCERVYVNEDSISLFIKAQIRLWPYWVAIGVSTWTTEHGRWPLKLAPFFIPPFRVLLLNRWGGFFPGRPLPILLHLSRLWLGSAISGWTRLKEVGDGVGKLLCYHIWRSSPVRRMCDVTSGFTLFALGGDAEMAFLPVSWLVPEHARRCASGRGRRCLRQWRGPFRAERAFLGRGPLHPLCSFERCPLDLLAEDRRGLHAPHHGCYFA